jgi:hypothetical protein
MAIWAVFVVLCTAAAAYSTVTLQRIYGPPTIVVEVTECRTNSRTGFSISAADHGSCRTVRRLPSTDHRRGAVVQ